MNEKDYKALSIREFTEAAERYEGDHAGLYKMCQEDYPYILAELKKEPWETLLDAGCGPGPMIALLAEQYPERYFTGIDLTPKMIEVAQEKQLPHTRFLVGDCEALPFPENSFDAVICANSFHHYPNPQRFFDSVQRVLRPGGRLILRDYTSNSGVLLWLCNHLEMPLAHLFGHGDVAMHSCQEVDAMCRAAGLTVERIEKQKKMRLHCVARKPMEN